MSAGDVASPRTTALAATSVVTSRWNPAELSRRVEQADGLKFLVQGPVTSLRGAAVRFAFEQWQEAEADWLFAYRSVATA